MLKIKTLQKKRTQKQAELKQLRAKRKQLRADEDALEAKIDELEEVTPELEQQVEELTQQQTETDDAIADLQDEIDALTEQIDALEAEPGEPEDDGERDAGGLATADHEATVGDARMVTVQFLLGDEVHRGVVVGKVVGHLLDLALHLGRVRALAGAGRRSVTGAELTIPEVVLDILRDNLHKYSKLISKVRLRTVRGHARQQIIGEVPEGIWTEMVGALNELDFSISELEVDGFKVGGFMVADNSTLADSDINLGEEILYMLGQSIGLAYDKAVVFGMGPGSKMPVGIVTRLAETAQPAYWGANRPEWTDLHTSHILKLNLASAAGESFFIPFLGAPQLFVFMLLFFMSGLVAPYITPDMIADFSAVGGIVTFTAGLRLSRMKTDIKVLNLLPSLPLAFVISALWTALVG